MKRHKLLILILIFAAVLRFYKLGSLPALNADEAAIGYNAYSLIKTGLDEHGNSWPIHFESFADYKPGLYFYLALPFIKILGLNIWSVRIPGALMGILNVWAIYLLVKAIWPKRDNFALLSALLLAISPWHLHFSRGAWEVNFATTLITFALYLFVKGLKNSKLFALSGLFFVASLYTYHAARLIVPLMGFFLFIFYFVEILKMRNKKMFFGSILISFCLLVPLIFNLLGPSGTARASGVSIFSDRGPIDRINQQRGEHQDLNSLQARLLHNKPVEYTLSFTSNYLEHFWGEFLFLSGDEIQRNKVPEMGQLYLFQFPLIIFALYFIIQKPKKWRIILIWLFVSPMAAAITFQSPHALRAQNMVIPLTIISAYGLTILSDYLYQKLKNKKILVTSYLIIAFVVFWSFGRYIHQYYLHMAKTYSFSSQYGVEELVSYINENNLLDKYEKIYITDRYDQPYILFLFYFNYPPEDFQNDHLLTSRDEYGFSTVPYFDKFVFTKIDWDELRDQRNILVAGTDEEIVGDEANVIKEIYFPNGQIAFEIVEL